MSDSLHSEESEGIIKQFALLLLFVLVGYALIFGCNRYLSVRKGPWELTFSSQSDGTPILIVDQPALGIVDATIRFEGESVVPGKPMLVLFDERNPTIPFGKVLYANYNRMPGLVTLELFGHEIELIHRALIMNFREYEWESGAIYPLKPEHKWRLADPDENLRSSP